MSYYTSYETSVALREAGASQEIPAGGGYWRDFGDSYARQHYVTSVDREAVDDVVRSLRLDEILEALHGNGWQLYEEDNLDYVIGAEIAGEWTSFASPPALPWGPVEAAAACWLAVMRAKS